MLQQVIASDTEMDAGCVGVGRTQLPEHGSRVGEHEPLVVGRAQRAGPRVEQLEGAGAILQLAADGCHCVLHEPIHQRVPQHGIGVHQPLRVLVGAARPAFHEVAGNGEGRPGERQQRHLLGQVGHHLTNRLEHVRRVCFRLEFA